MSFPPVLLFDEDARKSVSLRSIKVTVARFEILGNAIFMVFENVKKGKFYVLKQ